MRQYHELLRTILEKGNDRNDRTQTGTRSCFGLQFRHNLAEGFPLLTTKKLPFKAVVVELLWFLKGDTNIKYLLEHDVHIWTADAYRMYKRHYTGTKARFCNTQEEFERQILYDDKFAKQYGDLGPIYGAQWRQWAGVVDSNDMSTPIIYDQIKNVINQIKINPEGRRHIVTAWNPAEIDNVALPACHCLFQFYVHDNRLSCHMYQRSADVFLGVPFNIASYALLTHIIAHQTGLGVGELIISFGDVHIYSNHIAQVEEQLSRAPKELPTLDIMVSPLERIEDYTFLDFRLNDYDPHPSIKGELSVGV